MGGGKEKGAVPIRKERERGRLIPSLKGDSQRVRETSSRRKRESSTPNCGEGGGYYRKGSTAKILKKRSIGKKRVLRS